MLAKSYSLMYHNVSILKSRLDNDSGIRYNRQIIPSFSTVVVYPDKYRNVDISPSTSQHKGLQASLTDCSSFEALLFLSG